MDGADASLAPSTASERLVVFIDQGRTPSTDQRKNWLAVHPKLRCVLWFLADGNDRVTFNVPLDLKLTEEVDQ